MLVKFAMPVSKQVSSRLYAGFVKGLFMARTHLIKAQYFDGCENT